MELDKADLLFLCELANYVLRVITANAIMPLCVENRNCVINVSFANNFFSVQNALKCSIVVVEDTRSRPRTQKIIRGQRQECSRPRTHAASVFKKKGSKKRSGALRKKKSKKFSGDLQNFNNLKNSAVLELRAGQFRGLEVSRPRQRTSKCVLEDSTSGTDHLTVSHEISR